MFRLILCYFGLRSELTLLESYIMLILRIVVVHQHSIGMRVYAIIDSRHWMLMIDYRSMASRELMRWHPWIVTNYQGITWIKVWIDLCLVRHDYWIIRHLGWTGLYLLMLPYLSLHRSLANTMMMHHISWVRCLVNLAPVSTIII